MAAWRGCRGNIAGRPPLMSLTDLDTPEHRRLAESATSPRGIVPKWRKWGCYVADRAWATVREDYSPDGNAWAFFPHDTARSKAYRWGEDGIAALCDRYQLLGERQPCRRRH